VASAVWINTQALSSVKSLMPASHLILPEIGWASNHYPPDPSWTLSNEQAFVDAWVCSADSQNSPYVWYSIFDEPARAVSGSHNNFYGLFAEDGSSKGLNFPTCSAANP